MLTSSTSWSSTVLWWDALDTVEGFRRLKHDVGISDLAYY
jgi:hypothetical protein